MSLFPKKKKWSIPLRVFVFIDVTGILLNIYTLLLTVFCET